MPLSWIKLYIEILDDPKMDGFTNEEFGLWVKLLLLAGKVNKDGLIPRSLADGGWRVGTIATMLRTSPQKMSAVLSKCRRRNMVTYSQSGDILLKNFSKRQHRPPSAKAEAVAERVHKYREMKRGSNKASNGIVTTTEQTQTREDKTPLPPTGGDLDFLRVKQAYERDFGLLVPLLGEEVEAALECWPVEWILDAMREAVLNNVRKWPYVRAILDRWEVEGRGGIKTGGNRALPEGAPPLIGTGRTIKDIKIEEFWESVRDLIELEKIMGQGKEKGKYD